jgi:serine/threonine protein kinase/formylglycine-generating enzyme required for sulfatase activity/dienelactone hydrolase
MTPERWHTVKKILAAALEQPPAERSAYLDQACTEPEVRREVELLIGAHERAGDGGFMERSPIEALRSAQTGEAMPSGQSFEAVPSEQSGEDMRPAQTERHGKALKNGARLGPYEILGALGAGGMGEVYRARDSRLDRTVAIKVLPAGLLTDEPARRRFRKEALALARLSHPNIAAVYDVGDQEGVDYLVMECVPGMSLAQKLKSGPLPAKEVASLGVQIASALEEAHEQGVVHRDLKPANIMVTPKGHAKVLDFGLAKLLAPAEAGEVTMSLGATRGPVGTLLYMSPEQAEGKAVDSRSDLWSFGVVLYESLTGKRPFEGGSALALLRAVTEDTPKPLRKLSPDTPEEADRIVSHALEKDVTKRYQSAAEMSRDLSAVAFHLSDAAIEPASRNVRLPFKYAIPAGLLAAFLAAGGFWFYQRSEKRHWAREEAIPSIAKLEDDDQSLAAFLLLKQAEKYLPSDPQLAQVAADDTRVVSIASSPPGATVEIQDYLLPNSEWYRLGETPITNITIPTGCFRWKVSKQGVGEFVSAPETYEQMNFALDSEQAAPPGMSWVDGRPWASFIQFVGPVGGYTLPSFYIDRFEVTNRQYQEFVDSGGYAKRELWPDKFVEDGRELSWSEAMDTFRDSTGRPGPSTWEGGHYPEGQADYPVSGVSWYEASAYAAFAGKSLPAFAQWYLTAPPDEGPYIIRASNISLNSLAPVGAFRGLGPYGTYDMAGNVREWVQNDAGENRKFILGGAWNSQSYFYSDPEALSPFDRSPTNGFRCVRNTAPLPQDATATIKTIDRDFSAFKPASDDVFRVYRAMYAYDKTPLNAKVEGVVQDTADWREEKITYDAAYNNERMAAYLFVPKKVQPPYQTVIFFPSANILSIHSSQTLGDIKFFDYIVQSGRAVLYPVYQDTYERRLKHVLPGSSSDMEYLTQRAKDVGRSLDYLATRTDIDNDKLAYLGVSMGSAEGVIYSALYQDKLKTAVFLDGGYFLYHPPIGGDQADFAPRLKKPVLMVNGRYDYVFAVKKAQDPMFRMLGAPEADKRHVLLDTPHDVTNRRPELVKEVLAWLDKYLGRIN